MIACPHCWLLPMLVCRVGAEPADMASRAVKVA
jgi:hypothetical protein